MDQLLIDISNLIVAAAPNLMDLDTKYETVDGEVCEQLVDDILRAIDHNREEPWRQYGAENVWGEHPGYPRSEWGLEAFDNDTSLGYWAWVASCIEADEQEAEALRGSEDFSEEVPIA